MGTKAHVANSNEMKKILALVEFGGRCCYVNIHNADDEGVQELPMSILLLAISFISVFNLSFHFIWIGFSFFFLLVFDASFIAF